jgi:hypothetical protein
VSFRKIAFALGIVATLWVAPALANGIWGHIESLDPILQRRLQEALVERGFDPGPIDGRYGERTEAAVIAFRQANGIIEDEFAVDVLSPKLAKALFGIDIEWSDGGLEPELQLKVLEQLGLVPTESYWDEFAIFPD